VFLNNLVLHVEVGFFLQNTGFTNKNFRPANTIYNF